MPRESSEALRNGGAQARKIDGWGQPIGSVAGMTKKGCGRFAGMTRRDAGITEYGGFAESRKARRLITIDIYVHYYCLRFVSLTFRPRL
jgi:hypothetical protein